MAPVGDVRPDTARGVDAVTTWLRGGVLIEATLGGAVTLTVGVNGRMMLEETGGAALAAASACAFLWAATSSSKVRDLPSILRLRSTLCDLHVRARVQ